jgi:glycosyltransferase involved in cell wall biosynthesis
MHDRSPDGKVDDSFDGARPAPSNAAPLRVVHVVQHLKSGGAETLVRGLAAGLAAAGVAITVVSVYPDALDQSERAALGFPVLSIGRRGRSDVTFFPRLVNALRELRPDVVHAHLHAGKYAGRIAALVAGAPAIVFTEHGDEASGTLRAAVNGILHPRTTRFVTFNEAQRARFAATEGVPLERIAVIPNGVALPPPGDRASLRAAVGIAPDTFAAYLPARMTEQKNHALALRAFARVWRADSRRQLYLAGSGPLENELRSLVDTLQLRGRVHFLGFRDDAAALCRAMDLYLLPSRWERMPLALGEAMLAGLPVVTAPWPGYEDFIYDGVTGYVATGAVCPDDVAAFARALERTADDVGRRRIAERARAFALERFDLATSVRRHIALYESIVRPLATGAP